MKKMVILPWKEANYESINGLSDGEKTFHSWDAEIENKNRWYDVVSPYSGSPYADSP